MGTSERLASKIKENVAQGKIIKLRDNKIKEYEDKISVQSNHIGELERELKKWETMQQNGYTAVGINNGYVVVAVTVAPFSTFTYTQPIIPEISTKLYSNFPFVKLDKQGKMVFDSQQYKKYKGVY